MMNIVASLGKQRPTPSSSYRTEMVIAECPYCGSEFQAQMRSIRNGHTKSCGCWKKSGKPYETTAELRRQYPRVYRIWKNMRTRCSNPNIPNANNYGGRGISVCSEWDDFGVFLAWAKSSGYSDGLSIDRIDVDGDYSPDNCRWASHAEQSRNTQLLRSSNSTGFRGVSVKGNRFMARASNHETGQRVYLGTFANPEEAALAYDSYLDANNLEYPRNFEVKR